ncbi:MAG: outer membrane lipoprotein carrier protein LolA [Thermoanaerobaculia bacterium]|nr:outer membrane lipoprotein carrier protein LolA [Thermoanaerobaculia bacterium]MCZ7651145.1 outer membrane lipoprotein carrier protein LolA [Thermoanaerobaculia bacterium]
MGSRAFAPWLLGLLLAASGAPAAEETGPWELLGELRRRLSTEGAVATDFVQTFVPAGFATGERERGQLALAVPDCLRWDYEDPFPKSFLICGEVAYSWTPGEPTGRRLRVRAREQAGLDLLLLPTGELAARYAAKVERGPGRLAVTLEPLTDDLGLTGARLELDPATSLPRALAWTDLEGNRSRFEFADYRGLANREAFVPPAEVEWRED